MAESLLADTDAMVRGMVQVERYGRKWLVRYRTFDDASQREMFPATPEGAEEANAYFWACVDLLKQEVVDGKQRR